MKVPGGWRCLGLRCWRVQSMCRFLEQRIECLEIGVCWILIAAREIRLPTRCAEASGRDEGEYQLSAAARHALIVPTPKLPN